ncbi:MAG: hypothetical protein M5U34_29855 [Chloroflexi bacterium]|nr:hypothetical protein [Chloroflexota bacterium]
MRRGTLMAALAHERPLLSTIPQTPTPELIHGKNCWLVPANDAAVLAQAVQTLIADPDLRQNLGAGATAVAGHFTWDHIAAQTLDFFRELKYKNFLPGKDSATPDSSTRLKREDQGSTIKVTISDKKISGVPTFI